MPSTSLRLVHLCGRNSRPFFREGRVHSCLISAALVRGLNAKIRLLFLPGHQRLLRRGVGRVHSAKLHFDLRASRRNPGFWLRAVDVHRAPQKLHLQRSSGVVYIQLRITLEHSLLLMSFVVFPCFRSAQASPRELLP